MICRENEARSGDVQVFAGRLKTAQSLATVHVSDDSTVAELIAAALDQFGLDPETKSSYRLLKVVIERGTDFQTPIYSTIVHMECWGLFVYVGLL